MIRQRQMLAVGAAVALTGCDPLFQTEYRQALAPASAEECVQAALKSAPLIAIVSRSTRPAKGGVTASYHIVVRDSVTAGGHWEGEVAMAAGDTTWLKVSYAYMGYATPPRRDRARWESEAHEILEGVRRQCAPGTPSHITCKSVGGIGGQRGACTTAA
jgi:hypothetical protein